MFHAKRASSGDFYPSSGILIRRNSAFNPATLFAAGEPGFYSEAITPSRVWVDTARTTPGSVGQPVGSWELKTGSGTIYATQATTANKPILRQNGARYYLEFDGVDDQLVTPAINFTTTDEMTTWAGLRKLSDAAIGCVIETTGDGIVGLNAPSAAAANYRSYSRGTVTVSPTYTNAAVAAPNTSTLTLLSKISTDVATLRQNGAQVASLANDQGAGNYANIAYYIGRRSSNTAPLNGHLYCLGMRGKLTAGGDLTNLETQSNSLTGAY